MFKTCSLHPGSSIQLLGICFSRILLSSSVIHHSVPRSIGQVTFDQPNQCCRRGEHENHIMVFCHLNIFESSQNEAENNELSWSSESSPEISNFFSILKSPKPLNSCDVFREEKRVHPIFAGFDHPPVTWDHAAAAQVAVWQRVPWWGAAKRAASKTYWKRWYFMGFSGETSKNGDIMGRYWDIHWNLQLGPRYNFVGKHCKHESNT